MIAILAGLFGLSAGFCGLTLVFRRHSLRDKRWWAGVASVGWLGVGCVLGWEMRDKAEAVPLRSERTATLPSADATQPSIVFDNRWGTERENQYMTRYASVVREIGPPPAENAVPVMGYTDKSGREYPSRWRMPPNADRGDNLKDAK